MELAGEGPADLASQGLALSVQWQPIGSGTVSWRTQQNFPNASVISVLALVGHGRAWAASRATVNIVNHSRSSVEVSAASSAVEASFRLIHW